MKNNLENNKLIAEFMNLPLVPCNIGTENGVVTEGYLTPHVSVPTTLSGMQYKYKWDWLMPVVDKISNIKHWSLNATLEWLSEEQDRDGLYSIEDVYEAVVEFIKWYNSAKENTTD